MNGKTVRPRELARRDVEIAIDYYIGQAGPGVALRCIGALESTCHTIARHPGAGSPSYAHELAPADLRCRPLTRSPHLVFYVERDDHIDVWRVLHAQRDIPAWLQKSVRRFAPGEA